jgi:hypothetical protein
MPKGAVVAALYRLHQNATWMYEVNVLDLDHGAGLSCRTQIDQGVGVRS